jgi:hypothetical protein
MAPSTIDLPPAALQVALARAIENSADQEAEGGTDEQ